MNVKIKLENSIFEAATGYLSSTYGVFDRIVEQQDRPDAAIKLKNNLSSTCYTVGIEITTIDKSEELQYFNERKFSKEFEDKSLEFFLKGIIPTQPLKKMTINRPRYFLFESINKKRDHYKEYMACGNFNELIILTFSDYIEIDDLDFINFLAPWTDYLLSNAKFPFSRVLFVCRKQKKCFTLYDKKKKKNLPPKISYDLKNTPTVIGWCPVDKNIPIGAIIEKDPIVRIKKREKNSRKR